MWCLSDDEPSDMNQNKRTRKEQSQSRNKRPGGGGRRTPLSYISSGEIFPLFNKPQSGGGATAAHTPPSRHQRVFFPIQRERRMSNSSCGFYFTT